MNRVKFIKSCYEMIDALHHKFDIYNDVYVSNIPLSYFHILEAVNYKSVLTVNELTEYLQISQSNCSRSIKKIEELGYISKSEVISDRRFHEIRLTEVGRNILKENERLIIKNISEKLDFFHPDDLKSLENAVEIVTRITKKL